MLHVELKNEIGWLTLDHPERGNSFGLFEAEALLKVLRSKNLAGLILRGSGRRFFCTGGNLSEQAHAKTPKQALQQQLKVRKALASLATAPFPTVATLNGDCFGGGIELLSAFDHVIAAPHVLLGFWQRRLGLSFGWGGGQRLLNRLSRHKLLHHVFEAGLFTSLQAKDLGLVDEVADFNKLGQKALQWVNRANELRSFGELKSWSVQHDEKIFSRLWMNDQHKSIIKKHRRS